MTVSELIEELKKYPQDSVALVYDPEWDDMNELHIKFMYRKSYARHKWEDSEGDLGEKVPAVIFHIGNIDLDGAHDGS